MRFEAAKLKSNGFMSRLCGEKTRPKVRQGYSKMFWTGHTNMPVSDIELVKLAIKAREKSYAPYSGFAVGAALLCSNGRVYMGCNIENAAFTPGNCAERTAVFKAISEGERDFDAIAVVGGRVGADADSSALCPPCGVCRQVLREFVNPLTFRVLLAPLGRPETISSRTLEALLPESFGPDNLK
jgi:cytidine deaminase